MKLNVRLILVPAALAVGLFALSVVGLFVLSVWVSGRDDATVVVGVLVQFIFFAVGIAATFYWGRRSISTHAKDAAADAAAHAKDAAADAAAHAKEVLRGHGFKAVRRLRTQGKMIVDFNFRVAKMKRLAAARHAPATAMVPKSVLDQTISIMEMHIVGQEYAITDAILDWRDVVPEAVEALKDEVEEDVDG